MTLESWKKQHNLNRSPVQAKGNHDHVGQLLPAHDTKTTAIGLNSPVAVEGMM